MYGPSQRPPLTSQGAQLSRGVTAPFISCPVCCGCVVVCTRLPQRSAALPQKQQKHLARDAPGLGRICPPATAIPPTHPPLPRCFSCHAARIGQAPRITCSRQHNHMGSASKRRARSYSAKFRDPHELLAALVGLGRPPACPPPAFKLVLVLPPDLRLVWLTAYPPPRARVSGHP